MFVPELYLPSTKFVLPEVKEEILNENPENTKLLGEKKENDGEMAEKAHAQNVYVSIFKDESSEL
jgi:hypothetical protein